jgi:hypothetical protein
VQGPPLERSVPWLVRIYIRDAWGWLWPRGEGFLAYGRWVLTAGHVVTGAERWGRSWRDLEAAVFDATQPNNMRFLPLFDDIVRGRRDGDLVGLRLARPFIIEGPFPEIDWDTPLGPDEEITTIGYNITGVNEQRQVTSRTGILRTSGILPYPYFVGRSATFQEGRTEPGNSGDPVFRGNRIVAVHSGILNDNGGQFVVPLANQTEIRRRIEADAIRCYLVLQETGQIIFRWDLTGRRGPPPPDAGSGPHTSDPTDSKVELASSVDH